MKNILSIIFVLALGLSLGYFGADIIHQYIHPKDAGFSTNNSPITRQQITQSFAEIVQESKGAVVNVFSEKTVQVNPFSSINPFFELFSPGLPGYQQVQKGQGSGVIISPDGYVLTNNHVIGGAQEIKVALINGQEIKVEIIGTDAKTDLALLKLPNKNGKKYPYLKFGDSDQLQVGDIALAIGNPYGIGQTVTMGIISALKRENVGLVDYEDFIQTDAAINPGNSGGALINTAGDLIGINTGLYSRTGGYQGIGFSVPANLAQRIAEQLKTNGKVERVSLGVYIVDLNKAGSNPLTAALEEEAKGKGALVIKVKPDSLASRAGIKEGILITEFNNQKINSSQELIKSISRIKAKDSFTLKGVEINLETGRASKKSFAIQP